MALLPYPLELDLARGMGLQAKSVKLALYGKLSALPLSARVRRNQSGGGDAQISSHANVSTVVLTPRLRQNDEA